MRRVSMSDADSEASRKLEEAGRVVQAAWKRVRRHDDHAQGCPMLRGCDCGVRERWGGSWADEPHAEDCVMNTRRCVCGASAGKQESLEALTRAADEHYAAFTQWMALT